MVATDLKIRKRRPTRPEDENYARSLCTVSVEAQPLPIDQLAVGMYVSKLDRPWLETPFLFQGFHIESDEVIEQLRRFCTYVYVDVERSDNTIVLPTNTVMLNPSAGAGHEEPHTNAASSGRVKRRTKAKPATTSMEAATRDETAALRVEIPAAREAHDQTSTAISKFFAKLRTGETPDVGSVQRTIDPMIDSITRNEDALSWLTRMKRKDDYIYDHSLASAVWALIFGKHLGLPKEDLRVVAMGSVFMDVGKTKVPRKLLTKRSPLTEEEMALMKAHVQHGVDIVSAMDGVDPRVIDMVQHHHERYNGTGYPRGLSGNEIPIFAKIAGIIDTYDAMTTSRPYAKPVSTYSAVRELNKLAGVEFPAEVVEQFVQAIGVFPVGTLVELNTGEVGVVVAQNSVRRLRPKVMLILDRDKEKLRDFPIVDLRNQLSDQGGQHSLWIEEGLAPGAYAIDPSEYYI
jgi:HD-GYP domain-containing protein (c-di-GMP phosphodiesterase class II)